MYRTTLIAATFLLFGASYVFGQGGNPVIGRIIPKADALRIFGPHSYQVTVSVSALQAHLNNAGEYIGININKGKLRFVNIKKNVVYPTGATVNDNEQFYFFSTSVVRQLISSSRNDKFDSDVTIEIRDEGVVTVTSDQNTLDYGTACPPVCACPPFCSD